MSHQCFMAEFECKAFTNQEQMHMWADERWGIDKLMWKLPELPPTALICTDIHEWINMPAHIHTSQTHAEPYSPGAGTRMREKRLPHLAAHTHTD